MSHKAAHRDHITKQNGGRVSNLAPMSWALWDWASQPYFTLVTTFVFFPYFASGFIGDPVRGQELLGYALGVAGLMIAVMSPVSGAIADALGRRKPGSRPFLSYLSYAAPAFGLLNPARRMAWPLSWS